MTRAVIDIGSNSIRLMIEGDKNKLINTTQLAEGLALTGILSEVAIERTAKAINEFYQMALDKGVDKVYVFATEAVRGASNRQDFINHMKDIYNIDIDVLSSDIEARAGFLGASIGGNACIVDIGGASTEIIAGNDDGIYYNKSLPIGIVRLRDICGTDPNRLKHYIEGVVKEYGTIGKIDYCMAIGGTASSVVAVLLEGYNREKVHHYRLSRGEINRVLNIIITSPDPNLIKGLPKMRSGVIVGGIILLINIMEMLDINEIIVSEEDNMEGYLKLLAK